MCLFSRRAAVAEVQQAAARPVEWDQSSFKRHSTRPRQYAATSNNRRRSGRAHGAGHGGLLALGAGGAFYGEGGYGDGGGGGGGGDGGGGGGGC
ncbi:hypothetical protein S7711_10875 [Stachybotrys chartarum IBT 7711]|uniref:Uncharacterized protein n=1 Tax=Stachybotrys chartarum (strain CBS 109288 / IBT 7711) TaxID=1280523 RepID=A0A084B614_STACB|nr:hypothetical protein S7711_10875 [Stachybotrys chartarum IBT 7711]KFA55716.1 hypothetical protein S40293_10923 [Stachybotrys chartarum IBT 40293]KFA81385.1 hypothetical protein S40288_11101 [Stachybotrys chartarum IBT 40288]